MTYCPQCKQDTEFTWDQKLGYPDDNLVLRCADCGSSHEWLADLMNNRNLYTKEGLSLD